MIAIGPAGTFQAPKQLPPAYSTVQSAYGDTFDVEVCRNSGTANYDGHSLKIYHDHKGFYIIVPQSMAGVFNNNMFSNKIRRLRYRFIKT